MSTKTFIHADNALARLKAEMSAETKRRNDEAARAAALRAEAAAIGAELDPESLEQGD